MPMSTTVNGTQSSTPADWPVPEELRTVSVLFADIVGSTALIDRLDPEEVRALQRAYFDTVVGVLDRWGGVVEKYVGDAVMALFGARESDGHDAYRAVRAGLEIQRALDGRALPGVAALRTRVGVATGEALVDVAGIRAGAHGMASGAVITAAARLQEHAPPGGVVLCAATRRATAGVIVHRALGPLSVAGKPLPMDVALAVGAARPEPVRHHGPLVGRRRQLAAARDRVLRAARERAPRWVALVGPVGSGRSRVLHELGRTVGTVDGAPVRWYAAACPPRPEQPLTPVADLLRAFAGLRADEPPATVRRRLLAALDGVVPAGQALSTVVALEGLLVGPSPVGAAVWQRVLLRLADRQPVVLALDDADRAAPATDRFLRALFAAAVARRVPLAVVTTRRPQWSGDRTGPEGGHDEVPLPPLAAVETGRLLRGLLVRAGQPAALAARLLPLVAGSPGHAEAYVRHVADGTDPALPPQRVLAVAAARLDACAGRERAALMVAAALGSGTAAATVDRALGWPAGQAERTMSALAARGLLRRTRGGYDVADPALRRVAHDRLPRAVLAAVVRRAGATAPVPPARPATHPAPARPRPTAPARPTRPGPRDRSPGGGARPDGIREPGRRGPRPSRDQRSVSSRGAGSAGAGMAAVPPLTPRAAPAGAGSVSSRVSSSAVIRRAGAARPDPRAAMSPALCRRSPGPVVANCGMPATNAPYALPEPPWHTSAALAGTARMRPPPAPASQHVDGGATRPAWTAAGPGSSPTGAAQ
ncbi:class 3 adenylate cyclase [Micromonospora carbonacea subsp. aurantiaca]|nr:adenylate/guanylate cyclase domain-containing protein [Micromonospora carbonacea]MBB5826350.1 class 3 adenylate cyclase [Micromonospora carbonacea]